MRTGSIHTASSARLLRTTLGGVVGMAVLGAALAGGAGHAHAETGGVEEYEVKAAFIYNFAKFATWPPGAFAGPQAALVLCVTGGNPFGPALAALAGKPVGGRSLAVREVDAGEAGTCHLLFVARPAAERWETIAPAVRGRPVLTIGDSDGFARQGGAINLFLADGRVRFSVNLKALERSGVTLSSQVLRLARIVEDAP